jgi:hypothetical protein
MINLTNCNFDLIDTPLIFYNNEYIKGLLLIASNLIILDNLYIKPQNIH